MNLCNPVMCEDLDKARQNRERIANGDNAHAYYVAELALMSTPFGEPLPASVPIGELPTAYRRHVGEPANEPTSGVDFSVTSVIPRRRPRARTKVGYSANSPGRPNSRA